MRTCLMEGRLSTPSMNVENECTGALRIAQEITQGYWGRHSSS